MNIYRLHYEDDNGMLQCAYTPAVDKETAVERLRDPQRLQKVDQVDTSDWDESIVGKVVGVNTRKKL